MLRLVNVGNKSTQVGRAVRVHSSLHLGNHGRFQVPETVMTKTRDNTCPCRWPADREPTPLWTLLYSLYLHCLRNDLHQRLKRVLILVSAFKHRMRSTACIWNASCAGPVHGPAFANPNSKRWNLFIDIAWSPPPESSRRQSPITTLLHGIVGSAEDLRRRR